MTAIYEPVALIGMPAGVLRDACAAATLAYARRVGDPHTGLPAADSVGIARAQGHWKVWAGCGSAAVVMNRPATPGPDAAVTLDGTALRGIRLPAVLRCFRARCWGATVVCLAKGWKASIQRRRLAPQDPAGLLLGLVIAGHRRCPAPDHPGAVALAAGAPWFVPVFAPNQTSTRCAAMTARRIVVVDTRS